jgi:hypothetical protein
MGRILAVAAAALLVASTQAQAFCRDDLKDMEPRLQRLKTTNKERYGLASHWYGLALEYEPISEAQCRTYYLRAQKAMTDPLIQVNDCAGPNAYLPRCNNGGLPPGGPAYAPPGFGPIGAGGGGAGGGGGAVQPGPPVQPTFKPPGPNGSSPTK